jgi:dipeptidyl aminopeptidase/acylaminoacyl peptidase
MRPLALGNHPNIVYIFNQGTAPSGSSFAELKRYDVTTGSKTTIVHLPGVIITEAQVSNDGQWILFNSNTGNASEIQMVRMDGQGLQTLLCVIPTTLHSIQWSPDHSMIVYSAQSISGLENVYLLNMATGVVQPEIVQKNSASMGFEARTWLDNTRVYLVGVPNPPTPSPLRSLYILDTKKGPNQPISNLLQVISPTQPQYCWSFDSDYNTTRLVTSQCSVTFPPGSNPDRGIQQGPSSISTQAITGDSRHNIYSSQNLAVAEVRLPGYSSTSLLLTVENHNYGSAINVDSSQNGLWKMNTDGTGLTRLTTVDGKQESNLNQFSQYPWSNVSRDGVLYAVQVTDLVSKTPTTTLFFGPVSGGNPTSFAFANTNAGTVEVAGWTTM